MRAWVLALAALPACAQTELHLTFGVLQKMVAAQMFTDDGRKYVKGAKGARCNFAYLENPVIGEAEGRLVVRARFSGRSALNVLGQCVGLGDSFDVVIRMVPYAEKRTLRLRDVEAASVDKRGLYARAVCRQLAETIPRVLVYDFGPDFKRALESDPPGAPFRTSVDELTVQGLRVSRDGLVMQLGLKVTLR